MTLPFKNNNCKKYRCFVCGQDFNEYDLFKNHVAENHEKGREYLNCHFCDAPVRDLRLHYKAKHPNMTPPKDGQMKATIWYDFSGVKRKTKKKVNFKEGYFISPKNNHKEMHYRSGYELEIYQLLEEYKMILAYEVEPKDCITPYWWQGKDRKYYPDLKVVFIDGSTEIWEIKPSSQTSEDFGQNHAKWEACASLAEKRGWTFSVKTEQGIGRLKMLVKNQSS